jgi:23S rRNA (cytosine1962-C5)-methyltransferase
VALFNYELLDFGNGRKLEQFGSIRLDRPSPPADAARPTRPQLWSTADARFQRTGGERGQWHSAAALPGSWMLNCEAFQLVLKPTPFGHVGVFPEQQANWRWIAQRVARWQRAQPQQAESATALQVLNLFAYTGGSTLAAAAAGAQVVHLDAARNVVRWARQNAAASGLTAAPIRWIVDDARRYVQRELRRGHRYDALILDPPSYGHGANDESWRLGADLMPLLADCRRLLSDQPVFALLTCHSPRYGPAEVGACLQETLFGRCSMQVEAQRLAVRTAEGRMLSAGAVARWSRFG